MTSITEPGTVSTRDQTGQDRQPKRRRSGLALVAALGVIVVVAAACDFQGTWAAVSTLPSPPGAPLASAQVVSCTPAGTCVRAGTTAEAWNGTSWSALPAPPNQITGLSCVTASDCLAISAGASDSPNQFVYHFDGTTWTSAGWPVADVPRGVSCGAASLCMVVGLVMSNQHGVAERWNGSVLSATTLPATTPQPAAVSCPSATFCLAVGDDGTDTFTGWGATWTGGTHWTTAPTANVSNDSMRYVSCISATQCTATVGDELFQVTTWNGTTLTGGPQQDPTDFESGYYHVACGSGTSPRCFAVSFDTESNSVSLAPLSPSSGAGLGFNDGTGIADVSCSSATSCMAVGSDPNGAEASWHFNGTTWTAVASGASAADAQVDAMSCPTSSFCMAVGSTQAGSARAAYATVWNGVSWALPSAPLPAGSGLSVESSSVSCTSSTFCMVALDQLDSTIEFPTPENYFWIWNGSTWAASIGSFSGQPAAVSCTSPTSCLVVTASEQWTWNGTSFAHTTVSAGFAGGTPLVSCVSAIRCAVAMEYDPGIADPTSTPALAMWNGASFTNPVPAPAPAGQVAILSGLSCTGPTNTLCMVVGGVGPPGTSTPAPYAAQSDGTGTWTTDALPVGGPGSLHDVSCADAAECVAVGTATVQSTAVPRLALGFSINTWFRAPDLPSAPSGSVTWTHLGCVSFHCQTLGQVGPAGARSVVGTSYSWTDSSS